MVPNFTPSILFLCIFILTKIPEKFADVLCTETPKFTSNVMYLIFKKGNFVDFKMFIVIY